MIFTKPCLRTAISGQFGSNQTNCATTFFPDKVNLNHSNEFPFRFWHIYMIVYAFVEGIFKIFIFSRFFMYFGRKIFKICKNLQKWVSSFSALLTRITSIPSSKYLVTLKHHNFATIWS